MLTYQRYNRQSNYHDNVYGIDTEKFHVADGKVTMPDQDWYHCMLFFGISWEFFMYSRSTITRCGKNIQYWYYGIFKDIYYNMTLQILLRQGVFHVAKHVIILCLENRMRVKYKNNNSCYQKLFMCAMQKAVSCKIEPSKRIVVSLILNLNLGIQLYLVYSYKMDYFPLSLKCYILACV